MEEIIVQIMGILKYVLDLTVIFILLGCIISGVLNGFARTVVGLCGNVLALVGAFFTGKWVAGFVPQFLGETVRSKVTSIVHSIPTEKLTTSVKDVLVSQTGIEDKNFIQNILSIYMEKNDVTQKVSATSDAIRADLVDVISVEIVLPILTVIVQLLAFILAFFVITLILKWVLELLKVVKYIPFIGSLNTLLGGVVGFVKATIVIVLMVILVQIVLVFNSDFSLAVEGSVIFKYVYNMIPLQF